jgi:hypothetical protein
LKFGFENCFGRRIELAPIGIDAQKNKIDELLFDYGKTLRLAVVGNLRGSDSV